MNEQILSRPATASALLRPVYVLTVLTGSFLLFLIQPMFARIVLPLLGGSPQVWTASMLFFQAALLGGYLYAHLIRRLLLRRQLALHVALFAAAGLTLPVAASGWYPALAGQQPAFWLIGLLAVSIGPVFVAVAAQAPLMQAWFARTDDPQAADPYFLYAASNLGSLAALAAYPLAVEPFSGLAVQSLWWSLGFGLLAALMAASGVMALRRAGPGASAPPEATELPSARLLLRWTLLAAVPSGLLLSTTSHLTTDVMAMPLLWVIPLAAYLLSFIVAFSSGGVWATRWAVRFAPAVLLILGGSAFLQIGWFALVYALLGVVLLFVVALALHGLLAEERPPAAQLTAFYLAMSVGGALGGLFCALVAPLVFDWTYEHPILLLAAAALVPAKALSPRIAALWNDRRAYLVMMLVFPIVTAGIALWTGQSSTLNQVTDEKLAGIVVVAAIAIVSIGRRVAFLWHFAMLMLALGGWREIAPSFEPDARERSFFGVYTLQRTPEFVKLLHGTTLHGVQSRVPRFRDAPMSYYVPGSGVGFAFAAAPQLYGPAARIGFVGLGTGTLACYAKYGQTWTVYEIDPVIVRIATNPKLFTYLKDCKPDIRIVLGDARTSLAAGPAGQLDMLAVDAFSSDAIPTHLLTREAFRVYARALSPDGVLMVHISNRFLELAPVVAANAAADGWTARELVYVSPETVQTGDAPSSSDWIALTRTPAAMARLQAATPTAGWFALAPEPGFQPWTDDYASIVPVLKVLREAS